MLNKKIIKKILSIAGWLSVIASIVLLIFGFGENGFKILREVEFWTIVNSLWILAVLVFTIEKRVSAL